MLETVREFALDQLHESGEADTARRRHAEYFAELAERAEQEYHSQEVDTWLDQCRAELANFRAALTWCTSDDGDPVTGLRLAGRSGGSGDDRAGLSRPAAAGVVRPDTRGPGVVGAGTRTECRGAGRGTRPGACGGRLAAIQADDQRARALLEDAVALSQEAGDPFGLARAQWFLGWATGRWRGQGSRPPLEAAAAGFRALNAPGWAGMALWDLADAAVHAGDADRARALAAEALELSRRAGFKDGEALALERLGWLALGRDDRTEAERYFQEALALQLAHDDWYAVAVAATDLAHLAAAQGEAVQAARLASAAAALCEAIGVEIAAAVRAVHPGLTAKHSRLVADLRATLGEERFATAWAAGSGNTPEEALATVRAVSSGHEAIAVPSAPVPSALAGLSPREREVLALVAEGRSNKEIGEALFISANTVKGHVISLLNKLGADNRTQLVMIANQRGLL